MGGVVSDVTGSVLAGQIATATTFTAINAGAAGAEDVATNYAENQPSTQDFGTSLEIGAAASAFEGATIAAGGAELFGQAGADIFSSVSGLNSIFFTAATLQYQ